MAFSFNFNLQVNSGDPKEADEEQATSCGETDTEDVALGDVKPAAEHTPPERPLPLEHAVYETLALGTLPPLHYLNETLLERMASDLVDDEKILSQTHVLRTDLIPGVYEGGLKIWECTYDLLGYLDGEGVAFSGQRVLDLGCGAGLLGVLALKRGASEVHFQDYNATVMEQLTMPNVLLNCDGDDDDANAYGPTLKKRATEPALLGKCRFFSGDWTSFLSLMLGRSPTQRYDLILTSETIYNAACYAALHHVLHELLAPGGRVFLATKTHYFGVGGGLLLFQQFVEREGLFDMTCVKEVEQGLRRHVVRLSFKSGVTPPKVNK